jgi:hypothetical protein
LFRVVPHLAWGPVQTGWEFLEALFCSEENFFEDFSNILDKGSFFDRGFGYFKLKSDVEFGFNFLVEFQLVERG